MPPQFANPKGTERWRRTLMGLKSFRFLPTDFMLAWIDVESSGLPGTVSPLNERGLFQIHPGERDWLLRLTPQQFADLTDPAKQDAALKIAARMVQKYVKFAQEDLAAAGVRWHGLDFWRLVKLYHGAFSVPRLGLRAFRRVYGRGPANWDEFAAFLREVHRTDGALAVGKVNLPDKTVRLIPKTLNNAEETARRSGMPTTAQASQAAVAASIGQLVPRLF